MATTQRDLEFLYEIGSLRNMPRGWRLQLATQCASDLEHTIRVIFIALYLARKEGVTNEELIMKTALVHDLGETRTADHTYIQKGYVKADEAQALHDSITGTTWSDFEKIFHDYEERKSKESQIVKDADNLDIDIELKELEEKGHQLPQKWQAFRQKVRDEKLYTKSAKDLWDTIQTSDPAAWHLPLLWDK